MASFPSSIVSLPANQDSVTVVNAALVDARDDEIEAIETTLGTNPQGSLSDVKTRLAVSLNNDGTIKNDAVTFANLQNIATNSLVGRDTAGTGDPENILLNSTLEMDGSGNLQRAALTGDVTASAGNNATTIANDAVTNAKAANMADSTIKGRASGAGTGDPTDLTADQLLSIFDYRSGAIKATNTSGATAVANDVGYINAAGEYKTTTTAAAPNINWCVVIVGGADAADIYVTRKGRVNINVATGATAGQFLQTSTTAGRAAGRTGASPSIFALALTNESSNVCSALLLTGRTYVPIASANDVIGINASLDSDTNGTTPWYGTINDAAPTTNPVTMATTTGSLANITPNLTTNLAKMVMRNTTRGNEALISSISGNDVTFVSAPPANWVNGDAVNAESANIGNGYRLLDMSGQTEVPVTAVALNLIMVLTDSLNPGATMYIHPDETFSGIKQKFHTNAVTAQVFRLSRFQPLINMRFGLRNSSSTALATNLLYLGMDGYLEATP
jgi:hypothetical protein